MKTSSIALFLALSAGYLGAASADTVLDNTQRTGKESMAKAPEAGREGEYAKDDT
ncbi:hypothetical protein [Zobellella endophytica]|uniref:hypothetical protein n=1 Tax=Zobellella endophytica TaxID=2116700 RepID=UPI00130491F7|nr:hypothetical protein [Zobellella endophytica]